MLSGSSPESVQDLMAYLVMINYQSKPRFYRSGLGAVATCMMPRVGLKWQLLAGIAKPVSILDYFY